MTLGISLTQPGQRGNTSAHTAAKPRSPPTILPLARKAELIWCQKDHTKVWTEWMRKGKLPENGKAGCSNPVAETTSLGEQLGFTGTPTLVFPNGRVQSGYSPMPMLKEIIEKNQ